jgi:hypothetical protein
MWGLRMFRHKQEHPERFRSDLPSAPQVADIVEWAAARQATRAGGSSPDPGISTKAPIVRHGTNLQVTDDDGPPMEARLLGPGKIMTEKNPDAALTLQAIGFFLYVNSEHNTHVPAGETSRVPSYEWPDAKYLKPLRGAPCALPMQRPPGRHTSSTTRRNDKIIRDCTGRELPDPEVRRAEGFEQTSPWLMARWYRYEIFQRARLHDGEPLSSTRYRKHQVKENGWLQFQMFASRYARPDPQTPPPPPHTA